MNGLALEEQLTLKLVAEQGEHTVLDGWSLLTLERRGLVALEDDGWDVTPLGMYAIRDIAA